MPRPCSPPPDFASAGWFLIFPKGFPKGKHDIEFGWHKCHRVGGPWWRNGKYYGERLGAAKARTWHGQRHARGTGKGTHVAGAKGTHVAGAKGTHVAGAKASLGKHVAGTGNRVVDGEGLASELPLAGQPVQGFNN